MGASGSATPARVCSVLTAPSGTFAASHRHHAGPVQPFGHRLMFPAAAVDGPRLALRLLRSAGGSQPVFGHGACAVVYQAEQAECDADHPDAEHSGGGSPYAVSPICPRGTRCSYTKSSPAMEGTTVHSTPAVTARKQQDSLVMRRSGRQDAVGEPSQLAASHQL